MVKVEVVFKFYLAFTFCWALHLTPVRMPEILVGKSLGVPQALYGLHCTCMQPVPETCLSSK